MTPRPQFTWHSAEDPEKAENAANAENAGGTESERRELFSGSGHYRSEAAIQTLDRLIASPTDPSDEELLLELRRGGDGGARLFERYREPVWRFFRRRVLDASRAEELAQDVFAAVVEAAPRYQPRGRFRSYVFGIAYNLLMADRRREPAPQVGTDPDTTLAPAADPGDALWVQRALAQLDEADREVLMLREYEGLSYQEIAELQQIPLNTVRSRLFRARMAMRDALLPTQKEEAR